MKYLEEIKAGDIFIYQSSFFLLTIDRKSNGKILCYNLKDGSPRWLNDGEIVQISQIFALDEENNFVAIKETEKENDIN
jgi:hypothetical protein